MNPMTNETNTIMLKDKFLPTIEVRASKYATVKEFQKYNTDIDILLDDV
jgi:hypothetical protein